MHGKRRRSHQNGKSSTISDMSTRASSITRVESITSTSSVSLESDKWRASLSQLPPHLLLRITAQLDIVSKTYLQYTSRYFRSTMHVDRAHLNPCSRNLLALRFRQSGTPKTDLIRPIFLWRPSYKQGGPERVRYLDEPPYRRQKWIVRVLDRLTWVRQNTALDLYKQRLYRANEQTRPKYWAHLMEQLGIDPVVESLLQDMLGANEKPTWLAFQVLRCTHCGRGIAEGDSRLQGCLHCDRRLQGCIHCGCDFLFPGFGNVFPQMWTRSME